MNLKKITVPLNEIEDLEISTDDGFTKTVEEFGVLQNVVLKKDGKKYKVIAGRRRIQAARKAGLGDISAILASTENEAIITLIENIHRSGNPAAEAKAMKELLDRKMTQEDIAHVLHIDRSQVSKRVKLLDLIPELFRMLEKGELKPSVARELADLSPKEQKGFLKRDSVTLKDAQKARRDKTLRGLKKVPAEVLEPEIGEPEVPAVVPKPLPEEKSKGTSLQDLYNLSEQEEKILKHAWKNGLLNPVKVKRKPMDDVSADFGMNKKNYSANLVKARRKIVTAICELEWKT